MIVNNEQQVNAQAAAAPTAGQPNVEPPVAEQSIEETPTQNVDVQTNTEPRETVIEAPEVDFSNSTDTPPLPENNVEVESPEPQEDPGEPKKTFNYARAYKWVYQLNEQSGGVLSPDEVDAFAQEGLRSDWGRLYRKLGKTLPDNEFLITTYDSFWDVEEGEAEKKIQTKVHLQLHHKTLRPRVLWNRNPNTTASYLHWILGRSTVSTVFLAQILIEPYLITKTHSFLI